MHVDYIKNEIDEQLKQGKGCIIFDFGCYFPYSNQEILSFNFQLGMEEFNDIKYNHRYPNKKYVTLSKKTGRKVSKVGYPYYIDIHDSSEPMLLKINVGIKDKQIHLIIPLQLSLSKEYPVCGLTMHYNFDESEFSLWSYEKDKADCGWYRNSWSNRIVEQPNYPKRTILLDNPKKIDDCTMLYSTVISPTASKADEIML